MTALHSQPVRLPGDGLTLAGEAFGDPNAPPVIFFHGGGQSRRAWLGSARKVAEAGYRGVSFDLRGHGDSDWAADGDYMVAAFGRDAARLIDAFDQPVAAMVGASRGGQAALIGASQRPGRVGMVVLADVAPMISNEGVDKIRGFFHASKAGFATLDEAADALAEHLAQPRMAKVEGLMKAMRNDPESGRLFWHWDPMTINPDYLNPPSEGEAVEAAAALVKAPVVLVRAELSDVVTDAGVARFHELTPQLIVHEAKGVGHMFTGERNDIFAQTLLEHLRQFAPLAA